MAHQEDGLQGENNILQDIVATFNINDLQDFNEPDNGQVRKTISLPMLLVFFIYRFLNKLVTIFHNLSQYQHVNNALSTNLYRAVLSLVSPVVRAVLISDPTILCTLSKTCVISQN